MKVGDIIYVKKPYTARYSKFREDKLKEIGI